MATSGTSISARRYSRLIEAAQARGHVPEYTEVHHIVPRSLGGTDTADNLVRLTPREHFLAHWLLFKIHRSPATARAFRLMVNSQNRGRARAYAQARGIMAAAMRGDGNVARRDDVREKLQRNCYSAFAGKRRPDHSEKMRAKQHWAGAKNPFYGRGDEQCGDKNRMAKRVVGLHVWYGIHVWSTATAAAEQLGVSVQAVPQAIRKNSRTKGWRMGYYT